MNEAVMTQSVDDSSHSSAAETRPVATWTSEKPRRNLSGAARLRFRKLVALGMETQKALVLCRKSWREIEAIQPYPLPNLNKRIRSGEESVQVQLKKTSRLDLSSSRPGSKYSGAGLLRVGIKNAEPMNEEQMTFVHHALILSIAKMDKGSGPRFISFTHKQGWILVTCENQASKDWLVNEIQDTKPWPEAVLTVIPENELPEPQVGTTFVPYSEAVSAEEALKLMRVQNKDLNTELWAILHSQDEPNGSLMTFLLDDSSVEALEAMDGRAIVGFKAVMFTIRNISEVDIPETPLQQIKKHMDQRVAVQKTSSQCSSQGGENSAPQPSTSRGLKTTVRVQGTPRPSHGELSPTAHDEDWDILYERGSTL